MEKLSEEQLEDLRVAFDLMDTNGDGHITKTELGESLRSMGCSPSQDELQAMMESIDQDGDGMIDFVEFASMVTQLITDRLHAVDNLREGFKIFDKDDNGFIDAEELRYMMNAFHSMGYGVREIEYMIAQADEDGDDRINFEEFYAIMRAPFQR